jgi:hypothetical protein
MEQPVLQQTSLQQFWSLSQQSRPQQSLPAGHCGRQTNDLASHVWQSSHSVLSGRQWPPWQTPQSPPQSEPSATGTHLPLDWPAAIWHLWHGWQSSIDVQEPRFRRLAATCSVLLNRVVTPAAPAAKTIRSRERRDPCPARMRVRSSKRVSSTKSVPSQFVVHRTEAWLAVWRRRRDSGGDRRDRAADAHVSDGGERLALEAGAAPPGDIRVESVRARDRRKPSAFERIAIFPKSDQGL